MALVEGEANARSAAAAAQLAELREALAALRGLRALPQVLERATVEACRCCGFDRAVLFSVRRSEVVVESAHFHGNPEAAQEFMELARSERPQLSTLLATQIVRRHAPVLAADQPGGGSVVKPFVPELRTTSYVAAPIMPEGRVIGILYADRESSGRLVDEVDRDVLWAFAEGLGFALERSVLLERLSSQRNRVHDLMGTAATAVDELSDASVELGSSDDEPAPSRSADSGLSPAAESGIEDLLTRRELEVLALMGAGMSNAGIARDLVISEYTVKSHVKHILRKLGAVNRAAAVSRYLLALRSGRRLAGRRSDDPALALAPAAPTAGSTGDGGTGERPKAQGG